MMAKKQKTYRVRVVNPSRPGPQRTIAIPDRNPKPGSITIEEQALLEDLARAARESEDDWGIQQGVREYLDDAYANQAMPIDEFLDLLRQDVGRNYHHVGDGSQEEEESAERAKDLIARARKRMPQRKRSRAKPVPRRRRYVETVELVEEDGPVLFRGTLEDFFEEFGHQFREVSIQPHQVQEMLNEGKQVLWVDDSILRGTAWSERADNPQFRYAAVPVSDRGAETAYVVRGHRRADMVRDVAQSVPGEALVDLQRTRTFGTKHEAQAYGSATSPRVRALSRRISGSGS